MKTANWAVKMSLLLTTILPGLLSLRQSDYMFNLSCIPEQKIKTNEQANKLTNLHSI